MKAGTKLLLVGGGKMGGALLQCLAGKATCIVVDPAEPASHLKSLPNVRWVAKPADVDPHFTPSLIVIAVKPQYMANALPSYARYKDGVFLSIAAGVSIASMEKLLGEDHSIVRSMPNLPASIGQGMSVAVANSKTSAEQRELCEVALKAVGETAWVNDENLIDVVTALSGSGPAYVFALCEAMAKAGTALGLSEAMATKLARQTVIGSGALLAHSHESAGALRTAVTSPGGTTEAALKQLSASDEFNKLMLKAMTAAVERAKELAQLA